MDANSYVTTETEMVHVMDALRVYVKDQSEAAAYMGTGMADRIDAVRNVDAAKETLERIVEDFDEPST